MGETRQANFSPCACSELAHGSYSCHGQGLLCASGAEQAGSCLLFQGRVQNIFPFLIATAVVFVLHFCMFLLESLRQGVSVWIISCSLLAFKWS